MKVANDKPLVSVVVLNQNGLEYLEKTISPLLNLKYQNFELIVVDNGSTDGSVDFLKNLERVTLLELEKNIGYSAGKNIGVETANGEYVLLLDNDILISESLDFLKLINVCEGESAFLQIPLVDSDKDKTSYYGIFFSLYGVNSHKMEVPIDLILNAKEKIYDIGGCTGGCMFFKKSVWKDVGGFDVSQFFNIDDMDIGPRAWIFGYKEVLYTEYGFTHIGIKRTESAEQYARRFKLLFSGHARSMIKNYRIQNLVICFPMLCIFQTYKAINYSFKKRSFKIFLSFLSSVGMFLVNLKDTIKQRKKIQSNRVVAKDIFLKITPPEFL